MGTAGVIGGGFAAGIFAWFATAIAMAVAGLLVLAAVGAVAAVGLLGYYVTRFRKKNSTGAGRVFLVAGPVLLAVGALVGTTTGSDYLRSQSWFIGSDMIPGLVVWGAIAAAWWSFLMTMEVADLLNPRSLRSGYFQVRLLGSCLGWFAIGFVYAAMHSIYG